MWQPIETAPKDTAVIVWCAEGHMAIAELHGGTWGECLGGDYYGTNPGTPIAWMQPEYRRLIATMTANDKNPYPNDTPEWQLFENAVGSLRLEQTHIADAERYQKLAQAARDKAARFQAALARLTT